MRTDHRRPLAAFCFVTLACALVMWQPSLATNVSGPGPVVKILAQNGLFPGEFVARVTGGDVFEAVVSAAPVSGSAVEPAGDLQLASAPATTDGGRTTVSGIDAGVFVSDEDREPSHASGDKHADDPGRTDSPVQGPKDKADGHPGKGPRDKGWTRDDHPGKGSEGKADGHPGKGSKHQGRKADGHPGKGPKDKAHGHSGKGPKDKGWKRNGHPGRGPNGTHPRGGPRHDPGRA